jgi:geranylgeranylglycerol-phosphate geranylgeranyltransferase
MGIAGIMGAVQISRLPSCAVAFLTIALPTYVHLDNFRFSVMVALPVVAICLCTFILNDLNDLDRDRVNHPERALPSGAISAGFALGMYAVSLGGALLAVKAFVPVAAQFWYLALFLVSINYNTTVDYVPKLKNLHVAASNFLLLIIVYAITGAAIRPLVILALVLFMTGREMLMDFCDSAGDGATFAHLWPRATVYGAFALQWASALVLLAASRTSLEAIAAALITTLLIGICAAWRSLGLRRALLQIMKIQMACGIVFLF